jgi:ubiquinone/menaquinone biosynthesis C-methylase UbiE
MTFLADSSTQSWESIADEWVAHADVNDYRNDFLMPQMFAMLGDVKGLRILDLGCGEGGYSRELARRGAQVVGIDGSRRLIEIARERTGDGLPIEFHHLNVSRLDDIAGGMFDRVVASMSFMDVEDYAAAVSEVARVLRLDGELHMSITHPCFQTRVSKWMKDEAGKASFFIVDHYFARAAWEERMSREFRRPVLRRHRPLEDYMTAPIQAGLVLTKFHEPCPSDEDLKKSSRFWKLQRIPYFLFLKWTKR